MQVQQTRRAIRSLDDPGGPLQHGEDVAAFHFFERKLGPANGCRTRINGRGRRRRQQSIRKILGANGVAA